MIILQLPKRQATRNAFYRSELERVRLECAMNPDYDGPLPCTLEKENVIGFNGTRETVSMAVCNA